MTRLTMTAGGCAPLPRAKTEHRSFSALVIRAFDAIGAWSERASQRRMLAAASDDVLHDIGLSRFDADSEAEKPFWRK